MSRANLMSILQSLELHVVAQTKLDNAVRFSGQLHNLLGSHAEHIARAEQSWKIFYKAKLYGQRSEVVDECVERGLIYVSARAKY